MLVSATFLGFVVALIILYVSTAMNRLALGQINGEELEIAKQVQEFTMHILPIGSWVVPIISYFHGKSYLTGKAGRKNFSLFFSGLVLSFVLGFVFGVLALVVAVASEYAYPVHYPFMSASWLIIASYIFLLESNIWDFGSSFDSLRRLLVG